MKMKKSWHAPEKQLIHKFTKLRSIAAATLPPNLLEELAQLFTQAKESKTVLPDPIICGLTVLMYESCLMCLPSEVSAIKQSFQHIIPPGREKFMMHHQREDLTKMYQALYGHQNVLHVPLQ